MVCPVLHENFLDFFIKLLEFVLDLLGPYYGACLHRYVSHVADLYVFCVHVGLFKLVVKQGDTFFDSFKQLTLVFLDG